MRFLRLSATLLLAISFLTAADNEPHLIVLDPGHSHAAGVLSQSVDGLSNTVRVYAPPGPEVESFLDSVKHFNQRAQKPTRWDLQPYIGADYFQRMLAEKPGNVVVMSGRNTDKANHILGSLQAGQNVLADKPWIIDGKDFPLLKRALDTADTRQLVAYDVMTERFNVVYRIQRELLRSSEIFGQSLKGSASKPSVELANVHSLVKYSGSRINLRPAWFLDVHQQGQGITDVGTHLVDLEMWLLFPEQAIDYRRDVNISRASTTPLYLTKAQFQRLTGQQEWPEYLRSAVRNDTLRYDCNNTAVFSIRGVYASIRDEWEYESVGALSDSYLVSFGGSRATVQVRQTKDENYIPELDVIPNNGADRSAISEALRRKVSNLATQYPGLSVRDDGTRFRILIPTETRNQGGSSFTQLVNRFLEYVHNPKSMPGWEKPNMLAKYWITTTAAKVANQKTSPASSAAEKPSH